LDVHSSYCSGLYAGRKIYDLPILRMLSSPFANLRAQVVDKFSLSFGKHLLLRYALLRPKQGKSLVTQCNFCLMFLFQEPWYDKLIVGTTDTAHPNYPYQYSYQEGQVEGGSEPRSTRRASRFDPFRDSPSPLSATSTSELSEQSKSQAPPSRSTSRYLFDPLSP